MNQSHIRGLLACALLGASQFKTEAQLTVNIGTIELLPNAPDQIVTLQVSGVSGAAGLDFYVQVADGFPNVPGSAEDGPNITSVDIVAGTLFASNNDGGQFGSGLGDQHQYRGVLTDSGTVSGSGLLATLTLDTTGITTGSWALNLDDVFNGPTVFYDVNFDPITAILTDGTITVVPEPRAYPLAAALLLTAGIVGRRLQTSRRSLMSGK